MTARCAGWRREASWFLRSPCSSCFRNRGTMRPRFAAALPLSALVAGCSSFTESLDSSLLFRSRPADPERLARVSRLEGVDEVRIPAPDAVTLHGWLKRAPAAANGERLPLV